MMSVLMNKLGKRRMISDSFTLITKYCTAHSIFQGPYIMSLLQFQTITVWKRAEPLVYWSFENVTPVSTAGEHYNIEGGSRSLMNAKSWLPSVTASCCMNSLHSPAQYVLAYLRQSPLHTCTHNRQHWFKLIRVTAHKNTINSASAGLWVDTDAIL